MPLNYSVPRDVVLGLSPNARQQITNILFVVSVISIEIFYFLHGDVVLKAN